MYNIKLEEGLEVDIYLLPKNDKKYEGRGVLLEKICEGVTFFEDEEQLCSEESQSLVYSNLSRKLTHSEKRNIQIYEYLQNIKNSDNVVIKAFYKEMQKACTKNINSPSKMLSIIKSYSDKYNNDVGMIKSVLNLDSRTIIRFFQQTKMKNWRPTLFRLEKWKVKILPADKFSKEYTTIRWIKVLVSICPSDDHRFADSVSRLTTY